MAEVAETLHKALISQLSAAVRLAEVGQDEEARRLVKLAKNIQSAEDKMRTDTGDAGVSKIVKLNVH